MVTLTNIIPSLRRTIPDPLTGDRWPEHTIASTTDVFVSGVSLVRLSELCETPCVHNAAAVIPGSGGRPSPVNMASVVVLRVTAVRHDHGHEDEVVVDGHVEHCRTIPSEARLIGRVSTAHAVPLHLGFRDSETCDVRLPGDIHIGDLVAVPCVGMTMLRDVRGNAR